MIRKHDKTIYNKHFEGGYNEPLTITTDLSEFAEEELKKLNDFGFDTNTSGFTVCV